MTSPLTSSRIRGTGSLLRGEGKWHDLEKKPLMVGYYKQMCKTINPLLLFLYE